METQDLKVRGTSFVRTPHNNIADTDTQEYQRAINRHKKAKREKDLEERVFQLEKIINILLEEKQK